MISDRTSQFLIKYIREVIIMMDQEGKIIDYSSKVSEYLGYDKEELKRKSIHIIFPQLQLVERQEIARITAYCKNHTCISMEYQMIADEDGFIIIAQNMQRLDDLQRELERAKEQAEEAKNVKKEFLANVTHELRTPINGIQGLMRTMEDSSMTVKQHETIGIINQCCSNMEKLINNLLDFSRYQAGKVILEEKEFKLDELLNQILVLHKAKMYEKGLRFSYYEAPNIPNEVIGDALRLSQVLNNLLSNAVKFTKQGQISLEVNASLITENEVELFFVVSDTGIGIEEEQRDFIFTSFSQGDASITRRFGGTGLGLSICRQIVELMNGNISVNSQEGSGSTFYFTVKLKRKANEELSKNKERRWDKSYQKDWKKTVDENLKKLILCIELESWIRAEEFANTIKESVEDIDPLLRKKAFMLALAVRKEDYKKSKESFEKFEEVFKMNRKG